MQILEYRRALMIAIGLLAAIPGTPGCLRYECAETDITCKPQNALLWLVGPLPTTGRVVAFQKISSIEGGFTGPLDDSDGLGGAIAGGFDLNRDGFPDVAINAGGDDDGGADRGAMYVLFLNANGTVRAERKLSSTQGGLTGPLDNTDRWGIPTSIGDLDRDGVPDLLGGANLDDDGGASRGAVYVLFMNADGTVRSEQKISSTQGGLAGPLNDADGFGFNATVPGDVDGDGVQDLAVAATFDDSGGANRGAVYILFMNANGTVRSEQKISSTQGGFVGPLADQDRFGRSLSSIGDLDRDGVPDLAVGVERDAGGGVNRGAMYILFLNANGTVKAEQKISATQGGLVGPLNDGDIFGVASAGAGDLDLDGVPDLVVGADQDDGGLDRGAVFVLFLNANGTVKAEQKISDTEGNFTGLLDDSDNFGRAVKAVGDINGDRVPDLIVGSQGDDDGGLNRGAAWVLFLERAP